MNKILIVDDDSRMRKMLKQVIGGLASQVFEACDGGEAIAVCAAERPDWVLMDWRMKPMDGLHATAEIKARFPKTNVVLVSQYDEPELRAEAERAGACAYVLKENLQNLPWIITGVTRDQSAERAAAAKRPTGPKSDASQSPPQEPR